MTHVRSHILISHPSPAEARYFPHGEKTTAQTVSVCDLSVWNGDQSD